MSRTDLQVTLGLVISGAMPWTRAACLFVPQMLAGIVAAALVSAMFPGPLIVDTTLGNGTSIAQGLFIEMFLTALLMITILMLAVEKSKTTFLAPMGIGLALFVAHLTGKSRRFLVSSLLTRCFQASTSPALP